MVYKEVGNELPETWSPENEGDSIEGIYVRKKEKVGKNKANLYLIDVEGVLMSVWGSTVLDDKMENHAREGHKIKITFEGNDEEKNYHKYKLEIDQGPESD